MAPPKCRPIWTTAAIAAAVTTQPIFAADSPIDQARAAVRVSDLRRAAAVLEPVAKAGEAQAQRMLADILRTGRAGPADGAVVRQLYADAAAQGNAAAAFSLATMLANEEPRDPVAAQEWLRRSAANGYPPATAAMKAARLPLQFKPGQDAPDPGSRIAAWWAALAEDDVDTVQALADAATLRAVDEFGRTLLSRAAAAGAKRSLDVLIRRGGGVEQPDRFGTTPLMLAAASGDIETLNRLLQASALIDARDSAGNSALMYAARARRAGVVDRLIAAGADIKNTNLQGDSALDVAARVDAQDIVAGLRARGLAATRPVAASSTPVLPLQHAPAGFADLYKGWPDGLIAASRGSPLLIDSMIASGALAKAAIRTPPTALSLAVMSGSSDTLASLLKAYPGEAQDASGPMHFAVRRGDVAAVHALLARGASLREQGSIDTPLLVIAVAEHRSAIVDLLLAHDADIDATDGTGMTALMVAAATGQPDMVRLMLSYSAKQRAADGRGRTALSHAAAAGCTECAALLVDAGAQLDVVDGEGCTALAVAARSGYPEIVELLLKKGADPRRATRNGSTPLMLAAVSGEPTVIQRLLSAGSQVNAQDKFGNTALIVATRAGNIKAATLLIQAGADTGLRNRDRAAAGDVATALGFAELQSLLRG